MHTERGINARISGYRTAAITADLAYVGAGLYKRGTAPGHECRCGALSMLVHVKTGKAERLSPKIGKYASNVKGQDPYTGEDPDIFVMAYKREGLER